MIAFGVLLVLVSVFHSEASNFPCYECEDIMTLCKTNKPVFCPDSPPELPEIPEATRNNPLSRFKSLAHFNDEAEVEYDIRCMTAEAKVSNIINLTYRGCAYLKKDQTTEQACIEYIEALKESAGDLVTVQSCGMCSTGLCNKPKDAVDPPLQCFECDAEDRTCKKYGPAFCTLEPTTADGQVRAAEDYDVFCSKLTITEDDVARTVRSCSHSTPKGLSKEVICNNLKNGLTTDGEVECDICTDNLCNGEDTDNTPGPSTDDPNGGTTDDPNTGGTEQPGTGSSNFPCYECEDIMDLCKTYKPVFCPESPPELPEIPETTRNNPINRFKSLAHFNTEAEVEYDVRCMTAEAKFSNVINLTYRGCAYLKKGQTSEQACNEYEEALKESAGGLVTVQSCSMCSTGLCNKPKDVIDPPLQCFECDAEDPTCKKYGPAFCTLEPTTADGQVRAAEDYDVLCSKLTITEDDVARTVRSCSHSTPKGLSKEVICNNLKNGLTTDGEVECDICTDNLCNGEDTDNTPGPSTDDPNGGTTEDPDTGKLLQCYKCAGYSDPECKTYNPTNCTASTSQTDSSCVKIIVADGGSTATFRDCVVTTPKGASDSEICKSAGKDMGDVKECHVCHDDLCNTAASIASGALLLLVAVLSAVLT